MHSPTSSNLQYPRILFSVGLACLTIFLLLAVESLAAEPKEIRLPVTRDTWLSNAGNESKGANGGASRLKLKSIQELSLIDFDFASLRGHAISRARLYLKRASDIPIDRITLSTLAADWVEGTAQNYEIVDGQSTFSHRIYPNELWNDGDITSVSLGSGGTQWHSLTPREEAEGWMVFDVPVSLVEACTAGLSHGWLIMDDTGSTWKRDGESFDFQLFPNRTVFSKDSNRANAPYLLVETTPGVAAPSPPSPTNVTWVPPTGSEPRTKLTWKTDSDSAMGCEATVDGKPLSKFFIRSTDKSPRKSPRPYAIVVDPFNPPWSWQEDHRITLVAVNRDGKRSDPVSIDWKGRPNAVPSPTAEQLRMSLVKTNELQQSKKAQDAEALWSQAESIGKSRFTWVHPLDQFVAPTAELIPSQRTDYLAKNIYWDASQGLIRLDGSRGDWIGVQLAIQSPVAPKLQWKAVLPPGWRCELYQVDYIPSGERWLPDPLMPIDTSKMSDTKVALPLSDRSPNLGAWLLELYIPDGEIPGTKGMDLQVESDGKSRTLKVEVQVRSALTPKEMRFLPEMNCYDLPANELDYYRMAHRHRVVLNRVPYFQNGRMASGLAPDMASTGWDWSKWDARFEKYFTGEAFADLPRGKVPMDCFYLPMHENWPLPINEHYNGSYWADEAFTEEYRAAWVQAVQACEAHIREKGWLQTRFHVFLNNKVDFKKRGWSRGSSPWLLDEPANFQDYLALRYFGRAFAEGLSTSVRDSNLFYRCDVSRPQWQRTTLDGLMRYNVVSQTAFRQYRRLVLDRKCADDQLVMIYGSANPLGTNNVQTLAWAWDSWLRGGDGILPWQTIGTAKSWEGPDECSLFYPNRSGDQAHAGQPIPSVRLKAYCYAQQDVERLQAALAGEQSNADIKTIDRYRWGESILQVLPLASRRAEIGGYTEDAGWSDYGAISPETMEHWRRALPVD
ncbi:hypothetical protein VN12_00630 [Pirellula sp. SH-Sr6A]|uniref:glycoside hydrolase domain-containing protein n=1 Tax=Pirellula sp. SH-Sr6A TaxID=1632865 RepID=UPI00078EA027|nr:glycoside hydrolase domain-containing protein [Pirellula sp. SH-Sr6A]AMV30588.1 hypothetical protein VN12_00630 [Pirellula sp. SH-Sr6A]